MHDSATQTLITDSGASGWPFCAIQRVLLAPSATH
jgi:hypothetical protein